EHNRRWFRHSRRAHGNRAYLYFLRTVGVVGVVRDVVEEIGIEVSAGPRGGEPAFACENAKGARRIRRRGEIDLKQIFGRLGNDGKRSVIERVGIEVIGAEPRTEVGIRVARRDSQAMAVENVVGWIWRRARRGIQK